MSVNLSSVSDRAQAVSALFPYTHVPAAQVPVPGITVPAPGAAGQFSAGCAR